MSETPYLNSLRRARRETLNAVDESPTASPERYVLEDLLKLMDVAIRRLENYEKDHEKVTAQTLQEQERAKLNGYGYSHKELI